MHESCDLRLTRLRPYEIESNILTSGATYSTIILHSVAVDLARHIDFSVWTKAPSNLKNLCMCYPQTSCTIHTSLLLAWILGTQLYPYYYY